MTTYIIESPNGETHKLEVSAPQPDLVFVLMAQIYVRVLTEEDFLQELENPTF